MATDFLGAVVNSDGTVNATATPTNTTESTKGTSTLGKDAFLQLLVAQMKYQDPLNPTSDTEWISQMATFSSLEEMQNMNQTMSNMQAMNLVGQSVIMNSDGNMVGGTVDYVVIQSGKAYLAINGSLYSADDLDTVASEEYLAKLNGTAEEKSETELLTEAIESLVDKMETVGTTIDNAATTISDAAETMADAAYNMGSVSSSGTSEKKDDESVTETEKTETEAASTETIE